MFDELRDVLVKIIPFLLVMWMLTGAIYPAIDMTAGEKERGTMETLLISPAERTEIVFGKFLAVVAMGFGTAVWNVMLMLVAVAVVQVFFPHTLLSLPGWRVRAGGAAAGHAHRGLRPGARASSPAAPRRATTTWCRCSSWCCRSSYWSMTPGMELDCVHELGAGRQRPAAAAAADGGADRPVPVAARAGGGGLAGGVHRHACAAVRQFHRESVLFREAEGGGRRGRWSGKKG